LKLVALAVPEILWSLVRSEGTRWKLSERERDILGKAPREITKSY